ncbi:MAG: hypothetical protein ACJ748_00055 [Flavisolibacter sp.]
MLLEIHNYKKIGDLQEEFNKCFPYLRLEFYHHVHKNPPPTDKIESEVLIGDIRKNQETGTLSIKSGFKLEKLVHDFKKHFGLYVTLLRRHCDEWIACNEENYTLKELSNLSDVSCHSNSDIIYGHNGEEGFNVD